MWHSTPFHQQICLHVSACSREPIAMPLRTAVVGGQVKVKNQPQFQHSRTRGRSLLIILLPEESYHVSCRLPLVVALDTDILIQVLSWSTPALPRHQRLHVHKAILPGTLCDTLSHPRPSTSSVLAEGSRRIAVPAFFSCLKPESPLLKPALCPSSWVTLALPLPTSQDSVPVPIPRDSLRDKGPV